MAAKKKASRTSATEFVTIWQKSGHIEDVMTSTGLTENAARSRASSYRKHDVELKRLYKKESARERVNWDELKKLAKKLASK